MPPTPDKRPPPGHRQGVARGEGPLPSRGQGIRGPDRRYPPNARQGALGGVLSAATLLVLVATAAALVLSAVDGDGRGRTDADPAASGTAASLVPTGSFEGEASPTASNVRSAAPSPQRSAAPAARIPIVPVVSFWSTATTISMDGLVAALEGRSTGYRNVVLPGADRDAIAAATGARLSDRVRTTRPSRVREAVRNGSLGLLRATDVTPAVRALAIGDRQLFGTERVRDLRDWPLLIPGPRQAAWDPRHSWTLVAGGDILLDRGVARQTKVLGKGEDFPFDGGTVEITGYECCSEFGHRTPVWRRTGNEGAVRRLLIAADLAIANLESPVDDRFTYHTSGTTFSADPALLVGLRNAGLDFVSLGNNHIGDAGDDGIRETIGALDALGIRHSGAGRDLAAASRPAILRAPGGSVAIIGCDGVAQYYWAEEDDAGSMPCDSDLVVPAVRAARRTAAVVIVFPHWGPEYQAEPTETQRSEAERWIAAGADMVIGNHAHWTAAIEDVDGRLVFYALGNFVFDQDWSEATMQGMLVELTFRGSALVQAWLHPTLLIDEAQPNFLDPAADGAIVLRRIRDASRDLLPY